MNCDLEDYVLYDGKIFGQCVNFRKGSDRRIVIWSIYVRFVLNNIFHLCHFYQFDIKKSKRASHAHVILDKCSKKMKKMTIYSHFIVQCVNFKT